MARKVPRPFEFHWGKGEVVEEAAFAGEHKESAIQLLEYEDGTVNVRFCFYDDRGRFQRNPLVIGDGDVDGLKRALADTPRLKAFLKQLL